MKIPIQNIYYLLCYAWDCLEEGRIVDVSRAECRTFPELFARVLETGVTHLLKRGLDRGYLTEDEVTSSLRGKLDVSATLKQNLLQQAKVQCVIDSFDYNVTHNRIIKTTLGNLVRCDDLDHELRDWLMRLYRRLHDVHEIDLSPRIFTSVRLHRNNAFYSFLIHICRLIYENLLIDEQSGSARFRDFFRNERAMARIFEKFVRNFYRREQNVFRVRSERIDWQDVDATTEDLRFLPTMKTDVSLESDDRKIVIDTKYYTSTLQEYYGSETIHSGNLYQVFAYLKNLQPQETGDRQIEGVLLYPTIGQTLDLEYVIQGHRIRVVTVNLDIGWKEIRQRLLGLLESCMPSPFVLT